MITEEQRQRMELASQRRWGTNCVGTALYVLGFIDNDEYFDPKENKRNEGIMDSFRKKIIHVDKPFTGSIVTIEDQEEINHMGIITSVNPVGRVFHRTKRNGIIIHDDFLDELVITYSCFGKPRFYFLNQNP